MATEQAPQSPSAQPSFDPVRPVERSQSSSVTLGETEASRTVFPFKRNSIVPLTLCAPILQNFQEGARAQFLERQSGSERFGLGDCAATHAAQEKVQ